MSLIETLQSTHRQACWRLPIIAIIAADITRHNGQIMRMMIVMVSASQNTVSSIVLLQTAVQRCYSSRDEAPVSDCRQMMLTSGGCSTTYCCNTSCNTRKLYLYVHKRYYSEIAAASLAGKGTRGWLSQEWAIRKGKHKVCK